MRLEPGFWGDRERLSGDVIVDHCCGWMTRLGWIGNFRAAAGGGSSAGREFADSEIYKLLEALAWEAGRAGTPRRAGSGGDGPDGAVAALAEEVATAQEPDGYLNTRFGWRGPEVRYSDLEWGHELYCYGHLIQAAVARLRTGHEDRLVSVARRAADHVCEEFGADGRNGICGHPEIEAALAELYRATGEDRYLEQARLFVDRRGHGLLHAGGLGAAYNQDDLPVREARVLRGHAVRALYLAQGSGVLSDWPVRDVASAGVEQPRTCGIMRFAQPHSRDGRPCAPTHHPRSRPLAPSWPTPIPRSQAKDCTCSATSPRSLTRVPAAAATHWSRSLLWPPPRSAPAPG